jgi:hypothetical protein
MATIPITADINPARLWLASQSDCSDAGYSIFTGACDEVPCLRIFDPLVSGQGTTGRHYSNQIAPTAAHRRPNLRGSPGDGNRWQRRGVCNGTAVNAATAGKAEPS